VDWKKLMPGSQREQDKLLVTEVLNLFFVSFYSAPGYLTAMACVLVSHLLEMRQMELYSCFHM